MLKSAAMTIVLAMLLSPHSAAASPWTEGQAEWFRHGARHGRWTATANVLKGAFTIAKLGAAIIVRADADDSGVNQRVHPPLRISMPRPGSYARIAATRNALV
jgi:hypothetical protein